MIVSIMNGSAASVEYGANPLMRAVDDHSTMGRLVEVVEVTVAATVVGIVDIVGVAGPEDATTT
jgi:hypothetical protein